MNTDEINVLLERAGCEKVPGTVRVWNFGGRHGLGRQAELLQNTLILCNEHRQALAAALKKVLDEQDALMDDLGAADVNCETCVHNNKNPEGCLSSDCERRFCPEACFCKTCTNAKSNYKWRGPEPPKEGTHDT